MISILAATFITVIVINPSDGRGLGHDGRDYGARIQQRHDELYRWGTSPYQGLPYDSRIDHRGHKRGYPLHERVLRHDGDRIRHDGYHHREWGGYGGGWSGSYGPATGYE